MEELEALKSWFLTDINGRFALCFVIVQMVFLFLIFFQHWHIRHLQALLAQKPKPPQPPAVPKPPEPVIVQLMEKWRLILDDITRVWYQQSWGEEIPSFAPEIQAATKGFEAILAAYERIGPEEEPQPAYVPPTPPPPPESQPPTTLDRLRWTKDPRVISHTTFNYYQLNVTEMVYQWGPGIRKLLWCLTPFDALQIDGKNNYLFHKDFPDEPYGSTTLWEQARKAVIEAFNQHYGIDPTVKERVQPQIINA